jgi:hypothetical protein
MSMKRKAPKSTRRKRGVAAPEVETKDERQTKADAAALLINPGCTAAITLEAIRRGQIINGTTPDVQALADALSKVVGDVHDGNMRRAETMLVAQAHTLDTLFHSLAARSAANSREGYLDAADRYMRLALRAQNQARATLETLSLVKNPPQATFVRQANIAHGPQQVNNSAAAVPSRAGESQNTPNSLLEQQHGERLDTLTTKAAGSTDPAMATVGENERAENRRG